MHTVRSAGRGDPRIERESTTGESIEETLRPVDAFTADAAFDVVTDWIALIDTDCIVRRVNRAMADGLGVGEDELVGHRCHEVIHGTDGPIAQCPHLRLVRDSGDPTRDVVELPGRGLFEVSCAPLRDAEGALVGSVHMMHDVSRRVHVEMQAQETANYLQQVLDAVPTPIYHKDSGGHYVAANRAFAEVVGIERDAILGRTEQDLFPEEVAADFREHDLSLLARGGRDTRVTLGWHADLGVRSVELHRSVYADLTGRPAGIVGVEIDVTEREEAAATLRRAEADLVRAQEIGLMGSWEWDVRAKAFTWSKELHRIWGIETGTELTTDSIEAMVHPDDRAAMRSVLGRLHSGMAVAGHDFRIIRPDGAIRHLHQTLEAEHDADGEMLRAFGVMQDVTEAVETREALRAREALLLGLFDTMPSACAVYSVSGDGRRAADYLIKDMNRSALAIDGRRRDEAVGKSVEDIWPTFHDWGLLDAFWRVWRTGDPERLSTKTVSPEGYVKWYDNFVFKLPSGDVVEIYSDVTSAKQAEEARRASEAEMHAVFDLAGIPMMVMDTRGGLRRWNRAFQRALGYPEEDLRRMTIRDITPPEDRAEMLRRLAAGMDGKGTAYRLERRMIAVDGRLPWFDVSVTPVLGPDGDVVALIAAGTDITESRTDKEALVASHGQLRAALGDTVAAMGAIVAIRDPYTAGHERRVADLAVAIAEDLGLAPEVVEGMRHAASVHDVGKVAVPAEILSMPRRLSEWEYSLIQTHAEVGHEVLVGIGFEQPVAETVLQHHERLDGSGYPRGLKGDEIIMTARILAVADVVEAMASHRPYREALGVGAALDEIGWGAGRLYDEKVVAACRRVVRRGLVDLTEPAV